MRGHVTAKCVITAHNNLPGCWVYRVFANGGWLNLSLRSRHPSQQMTSKKKYLKQNISRSNAAHYQTIKIHAVRKRMSRVRENLSDGEDDAMEMERNFSLYSKSSVVPDSEKGEEKTCHGASEDENDGDDTVKDEQHPKTSANMSGSDDDDHDDSQRKQELGSKSPSAELCTKELSTMSFEEIIRLQNKVGTKVYSKIAYGTTKRKQTAGPVKQQNKNGPNEISAKNPVPFLRKVVSVKKSTLRDPRFDDLSGEFRPEVFKQTYNFIDEIRQQETQMVRKKLKKVKSDYKRKQLKYLLKRMENQECARQRQEQRRENELKFKRKQRELAGQGHKPFYLKKSDKKKLELAEKYSELKKSGKLENFLSKKRKRNAIKDRRKLPYQHNNK